MNEMDRAWLAGLYEGEGCLHRRSTENGYILSISMTDQDVVRRAFELAKVGSMANLKPGAEGWQPQFRWAVYRRNDIKTVLDEIRPWLGERRLAAVVEFDEWLTRQRPFRDTEQRRLDHNARMRAWRAKQR